MALESKVLDAQSSDCESLDEFGSVCCEFASFNIWSLNYNKLDEVCEVCARQEESKSWVLEQRKGFPNRITS